MPLSIRVLSYFAIVLCLTFCGRSNRLQVKSDRASSGVDQLNGGNASALLCQLIPSTSQITVPVNASGQLYPGYLPAPVSFNAQGTVAGVATAIQIPTGQIPVAGFAMVSAPANQTNNSIQFSMRPLGLGTSSVKFSIVSAQNVSANCETSITVTGVQPPDLVVTISANGASGNSPLPFTSGETAIINWSSNGASCAVRENGTVLPNYTGPYGEFTTAALTNATTDPVQKVFTATCSGGPLNETKTASVTLTINPGLAATLNIAGTASRSLKVLSGGTATLEWSSRFASRGCVLGDGENVQSVTPNGTIQIQNIRQTVTWTLSCWDALTMRASSVQLQAVSPNVTSMTANGTEGTLAKPSSGDVTISWIAVDVTDCKLNPGNISVRENGSRVITASSIQEDTTYTLTCASPFGAKSKSVTVDVIGRWVNVVNLECTSHCSSLGLRNLPSPEGAYCASGENVPASGIGIIDYGINGCWHGCNNPTNVTGAASNGGRCYTPGQKKDRDKTDWTRACYCG